MVFKNCQVFPKMLSRFPKQEHPQVENPLWFNRSYINYNIRSIDDGV